MDARTGQGENLPEDEKPLSYAELELICKSVKNENARLAATVARLEANIDDLNNKLKIDTKTGVLTEDYFNNFHANVLEHRLKKYHESNYEQRKNVDKHFIVMIDMDGLKQINTRYGYEAGDKALTSVATALKTVLRSGDLLIRMNSAGDEFILIAKILPEHDSEEAKQAISRRIHSVVQDKSDGKLSVSLGCSTLEDHDSLDQAKKEAEQYLKDEKSALYASQKHVPEKVVRGIFGLIKNVFDK